MPRIEFPFLEQHLEAIAAIPDAELVCDVSDEIGPEERVIGTLSDDLKRLWVYRLKIAKMLEAKADEHEKLHRDGQANETDCRRILAECTNLEATWDLVSALFWEAAKQDFSSDSFEHDDNMGVRKDWQFVAYKKAEKSSILEGITIVGVSNPFLH